MDEIYTYDEEMKALLAAHRKQEDAEIDDTDEDSLMELARIGVDVDKLEPEYNDVLSVDLNEIED